MGLGGISIWELLIILLIIVLLFGTKKLKGLGGDLGDAIKGFKKAITDDSDKSGQNNSVEPKVEQKADKVESGPGDQKQD